MAVIPTGDIFKTLTLDGVSSKDYSVYITGEAVFNSPNRDVEMITIPGRNGSFALDKGRFENIEVTYPAGIAADTEAEFREAISDFRNFLASRNGYVRLEDDYNPNEYRLAVYKSGLDVTPAQLRAGEFDITFDCKPQRYLKTGEDAISVDSGDVVSNPTLFASSPMLEVEAPNGGNIFINGEVSVSLTNSPLGRVMLVEGANRAIGGYDASFDGNLLNAGNEIYIDKAKMSFAFHSKKKIGSATKTNESGDAETKSEIANDDYNIYGSIIFEGLSFVSGTASQYSRTFKISVTATDGTTGLEEVQGTISYDGNNYILMAPMLSADGSLVVLAQSAFFDSSDIEAESTILPLGQTAYIDCDLGECYIISNDVPYSINRIVSFGSKLPALQAGANSISYLGPQSVTVIPRWWKI